MKRFFRKIKYDLVIYTSLFLALLLVGYSSLTYVDKESFSIKETFNNQEVISPDLEPNELKEVDKIKLIEEYLLDIIDESKKDQMLTSKMILDWKAYEVMNVYYDRCISDNYYAYTTDIRISDSKSLLPVLKNKELSTDKYVVISLNFNISVDKNTNEYTIKSIDIPRNN